MSGRSTSLAPLTDEALLGGVALGSAGHFAELVQRHQSKCFGMLLRATGSRESAQDLLQEVFVRVYRGAPSFRGEARFTTWLIRITMNVISTWISSRSRQQAKRTESLNEAHDNIPHESPHEQRERDRLEAFRAALHRLEVPFREVVTLVGIEGKSYEEAAHALEIPIGTVRSRLNSARLKLRQLMKEEDV